MHRAILAAEETTLFNAIPTTTPARTLFDLAAPLTPRQLERTLNEAERLRLPMPLEGYAARSAALRQILDDRREDFTRSELEERFLTLLDARELPRPEVNAAILLKDGWVEVDCLWRDHRFVAELDGYDAHGTRAAFEHDRARDRRLMAEDWRVVRITWRQLEDAIDEEVLRGLRV